MRRSPLAPTQPPDELADLAVRRGRNAGGAWIIASVVTLGIAMLVRSPEHMALISMIGLGLFTIGLAVRARYWTVIRRRLGDATVQRALWRSAENERFASERIVAAVGVVVVLLAFQLWRG